MTAPKQRSATAVRAALKETFRRRALATNRTVNQERRAFVMRRFLAVVFSADPDGWILKGGTGMMVRLPRARHTDDVDLIAANKATLDEALGALRQAVHHHIDGPFRYQIVAGAKTVDGAGMRLDVDVLLGGQAYETFHIDVVTLDRTVGAVEHQPISADTDVHEFTTSAEICLYPLPDQIADKLCAMYQKYGVGGTSSSTRYRDLVDLLLIAQNLSFDLATTIAAITAQRPNRRDLLFPQTLISPGGNWQKGWQTEAHKSPLHPELADLAAALAAAAPCYNPILSALNDNTTTSSARWDPQQQKWDAPPRHTKQNA